MVFSHEEFASTPTMEMEQQNQAIRQAASITSPNTDQSPMHPLPINEQQAQPLLVLPAAPSNNATRSDDYEANEFIDEEENIDRAFFESFPPGYRFCPTDSELIVYYLRKKIAKDELPRNQIRHVNLYQHSPDKISEKYPPVGEKEWYFFTPRDRKYRNGSRPNRAAGSGYWKATGADKPVKHNGSIVGYRKALVFYEGKPPKGVKTNWIMHEYRVNDPPRKKTSAADMRLDDFVLCRIYKKTDKSFKSRPRNEDIEDLDQNGYAIPQGNEIFDQNNVYPSDMDMESKNDLGGIDRELNVIEASAGYCFHSGFPDITRMMDTTSLANSSKCFNNNFQQPLNNNFQQPLNYGAKPLCYKGPPPMYPTENAIVPKYLNECPMDMKPRGLQENVWSTKDPTENDIVPKYLNECPMDMKPRGLQENVWSTKDNEAFNLPLDLDFASTGEFPDLDNVMNNPPPSTNSFEHSNLFDIPPVPKRS